MLLQTAKFHFSWISSIPLWYCRRRRWHPTPVLLPGKSHGQRSLVGWSPWGRWESDTTERFHFHFSLSCIGEGNGNPLQCSCLDNPRDGGAWWAAVYGVAQSQTRLKRLSSSSSIVVVFQCRRPGFSPLVGRIPWRRKWLPTPVLMTGELHEQRSPVGYSPWGLKESDSTEQLTFSLLVFHCTCMDEWMDGWICVCVCVCVYTPQFLYPFICWWTFRLLPHPGN